MLANSKHLQWFDLVARSKLQTSDNCVLFISGQIIAFNIISGFNANTTRAAIELSGYWSAMAEDYLADKPCFY